MGLSEINIREKDFHNELQSRKKGRFENIFYKAIYNINEDFFDYLSLNVKNLDVLDYGCGFAPALAYIFKSYGFKVELYDPFFFPNKDVLLKKYKFITCSEVVEHFFNPYEEFDKINNLLENNSWLGVMTTFLTKDEIFKNWYYRRDPTHVVFYTKKTFQHIGFQRNWQLFFPSENIVLFHKK